ncbi:hypothetical protein A0H81_08608 [Grifola frondosa]|uniref:Uncharacterized protein n=1 Tax=Grifola frondosa TaxID=5627 RepID=A0A1C7M3D6_GRIFR|nr:hypothetical protein A0H81_08608 [Grifola frondosa]
MHTCRIPQQFHSPGRTDFKFHHGLCPGHHVQLLRPLPFQQQHSMISLVLSPSPSARPAHPSARHPQPSSQTDVCSARASATARRVTVVFIKVARSPAAAAHLPRCRAHVHRTSISASPSPSPPLIFPRH